MITEYTKELFSKLLDILVQKDATVQDVSVGKEDLDHLEGMKAWKAFKQDFVLKWLECMQVVSESKDIQEISIAQGRMQEIESVLMYAKNLRDEIELEEKQAIKMEDDTDGNE